MNRKGFAPLFIILVVALAASVGGAVYVSRKKVTLPIAVQPPAPVVPAPQPSPVPTTEVTSTPSPAPISAPIANPASTASPKPPSPLPSPASVNVNGDVVAQNIIGINANQTFSIFNFPEAQFKINKIYKATGGVSASAKPCGAFTGSTGNFIFLKYLMQNASPPGLCFDTDNSTIGEEKASLVAVDLEVSNNGASDVYGTFLQLFYNVTIDGKQVTRLSQTNPPWAGYGSQPFMSRRILLGFEVPASQNEFQLTYGNYGPAGTIHGEEFFSRSEGGFIVNFKTKTIKSLDEDATPSSQ